MRDEGPFRAEVAEEKWGHYRGVFDIDGNVDAWGLRWRLESGSVVFSVESVYKNYFSDMLADGFHYITIARDFSELLEKTSLVLSDEARDFHFLSKVATNAKNILSGVKYSDVVLAVAQELRQAY